MTSFLRSNLSRPLKISTNTRSSTATSTRADLSLGDNVSTDSSRSSISRRITRKASQLILRKRSIHKQGKENALPTGSSTPTSTPRSSLSTSTAQPSATPSLPRSISSPIVVPPPAFIPGNSPAPPRRSHSSSSNSHISRPPSRLGSPKPPEKALLNIPRTRFLGASSTYIDLTRLPSRSLTLPPLLETQDQTRPVRSSSLASMHSTSTRRTTSLNRRASNGNNNNSNYEGGRRLHVNGPDRPGWTKIPANVQLREVINTTDIAIPARQTATGMMQLDGPDDAESVRNGPAGGGAKDISAGILHSSSPPINHLASEKKLNEGSGEAEILATTTIARKQNRTSDTGCSTRGSDVPRLDRMDSSSEASMREGEEWRGKGREVIEGFLERTRCWVGFRFGVALW